MASETRRLIRELQQAMNETLDRLYELGEPELDAACTHPCGHGPGNASSIWHLLANDIDHEKMHAAQILSNRHDLRLMQTQPQRLLAEWLKERAALIGALIGLPDEALDRRTRENEWSFREVVEHTIYWERDSIATGLNDVAGGAPWLPDPGLQFGGPVPIQGQPAVAVERSEATAD